MTATAVLAEELRRIGRQAGLDRVGICDARPFSDTRKVIEQRRDQGWAAGMQFTYRNPQRSTDPAITLPGARALIVGARSYRREPPGPPAADQPWARVARYSWVDHYEPLRRALGQVADRLTDYGWRAVVLADHNALVDRAAAVRAGIGWYGKNANVLMPGAGSWFVLGSVLTDAPIAPPADPEPVTNGCGSCRRCLIDCPTGALVGPGQLDARKCLAWLLQAPGVFPPEHRQALGDRIYGCDECQERCPENRRSEGDEDAKPAEPGSQAHLDVLELLHATDSELQALIGRWYIPGRELRYVRRNALVVLGNTGNGTDPRVEAVLGRFLADADPLLRAHAVWAAGQLGRGDLLSDLAAEGDPVVRSELERARGAGGRAVEGGRPG